MPKIQAVLFDLDGTLVDTVGLILASFRYATTTVLGAPLPDEALMSQVGKPLDVQMEWLAPDHASELVRVYREHNARVHDDLIKEYPGVDEALVSLRKRDLPLAVVTSKLHAVARRGLDRFNLAGYFALLVGSDDVEKPKPDPCPLYTAAEHLGVDVRQCIYLGDSPYDIQSANSAGAISVAALWGAFPEAELRGAHPAHALASIAELPALIDILEKT